MTENTGQTEAPEEYDLHVRVHKMILEAEKLEASAKNQICEDLASKVWKKYNRLGEKQFENLVFSYPGSDFFEKLTKEKWASYEMISKLDNLLGPYGYALYKAEMAREDDGNAGQ